MRFVLLGCLALIASVSSAAADSGLKVVATFSILGDLVTRVGGDRVAVETLIGPGIDPHTYTPKPTDVKKLAAARLIFVNGLGFESWIDRLIASSAATATTVQASRGVSGISARDGTPNPHAWQSVPNVRIYVANIRDALVAADAGSADLYKINAAAYLDELDRLDADIRTGLSRIPAGERNFVTPHPSFAYFGAAYDVRFYALQAISHESEVSAKAIADVVTAIRRDGITAIFFESTGDQRQVRQIARETRTKIGGPLYSDALTPKDGPAPTYVALMRQNLRAFSAVFRDPD